MFRKTGTIDQTPEAIGETNVNQPAAALLSAQLLIHCAYTLARISSDTAVSSPLRSPEILSARSRELHFHQAILSGPLRSQPQQGCKPCRYSSLIHYTRSHHRAPIQGGLRGKWEITGVAVVSRGESRRKWKGGPSPAFNFEFRIGYRWRVPRRRVFAGIFPRASIPTGDRMK